MWSIPATHPNTMSQSGRVTVFMKPHGSQTIIGVHCRRQLLPAIFSSDLHFGRRAHQQERHPPIYLLVEASPKNNITNTHTSRSPVQRMNSRAGTCNTVFTCASSSKCVCRRKAHPSTPRAPPLPKKPFFSNFFSPATVTTFFCRLNLHCFCVFWSSTTFSRPWELYLLIPTYFSSLWLKKVRLLIILYLELL